MALADIYVLEDVQIIHGAEEVRNVYTYQRDGESGSAEELVAAFLQDVQPEIENIQTNAVEHVLCRAYSLGDLTDFFEQTETGNVGNLVVLTLPSFTAVNFTLRAASRAVRPGSKRYAGVPEEAVANDTINQASYITALNALRIQLAAVITSPNDATTYSPVIVKRVPYVTDKGNDAYRYPVPGDTLVAPLVTGALVNLQVSHQVSRGNSR